jgi:hypothetical protein
VWLKRSSLSTVSSIFSSRSGNSVTQLEFASDDKLSLVGTNSGGSLTMNIKTSEVFRDVTAWYHLVLSVDTAQATASDRVKIYVNGSQITSFTTSTYPPQNSTYATFGATEHSLGARLLASSGVDSYFSGYMTEAIGVDGQALTQSSFGSTNTINNRWNAIGYSGTYGTNGFLLKMSDNSSVAALAYDTANSKNWTANNFSVTAGTGNDSFVDSPTNYGTDTGVGGEVRGSYATINPLYQYGSTLSNGNLDFSSSSTFGQSMANFAVSTGKWYWELIVGTAGYLVGIAQVGQSFPFQWGTSKTWYSANGNFYDGGTSSGSPAVTYTTNDIIGYALDLVAGTFKVYKNNTLIGTVASGLTGSWYPAFSGNDGGGTRTGTWNFGQRPFAYTAPSGHSALCSVNLNKSTAITTSGSFIGNASTDGTYVWLNGTPTAMTINGNAVTFGTHADRLASGFKLRTASTSYNASGSNTFSITTTGAKYKYARAQTN